MRRVTIDCGEGKHAFCIRQSDETYLIPQLVGQAFTCQCPCHEPLSDQSVNSSKPSKPSVLT